VIVKYYSRGLTIYYDVDSDSYSVVNIGTCTDTDIVIPSTYDDGEAGRKNVTKIFNSAFSKNTNIKSDVIPEGVTTIGDYAFNECPNLEKLKFLVQL